MALLPTPPGGFRADRCLEPYICSLRGPQADTYELSREGTRNSGSSGNTRVRTGSHPAHVSLLLECDSRQTSDPLWSATQCPVSDLRLSPVTMCSRLSTIAPRRHLYANHWYLAARRTERHALGPSRNGHRRTS